MSYHKIIMAIIVIVSFIIPLYSFYEEGFVFIQIAELILALALLYVFLTNEFDN